MTAPGAFAAFLCETHNVLGCDTCTPGVIRLPDDANDLLRQWFAWWRDSPDAPAKMPGSLHTRTAVFLTVATLQDEGITPPATDDQVLRAVSQVLELPPYRCDTCGMTSHNPNDIRERYCGKCHTFADDASD